MRERDMTQNGKREKLVKKKERERKNPMWTIQEVGTRECLVDSSKGTYLSWRYEKRD